MFWGLIIEPNKRYTQTVQKSFHISMAALDASSAESSNVQVMLGLNEKNYLLCTLNGKSILQTPLDLNFQDGDKIAFMHNGKGYVHLTGYLVPEDDMDDYCDEDEAEEEGEDEEVPQLVKVKSLKRKSESNDEKQLKKKKKPDLAALLNETLESDGDSDDSFNVESYEEIASDNDEDDADDFENDSDDDNENQDEEDSDNNDGSDNEMNAQESDDEEEEEKKVEVKKSKKEKKKKQQLNGTTPEKKLKNKDKETPSKKGNNQSPQTPSSPVEKGQQNNKKLENQQKKKEKNEKKSNNESGAGNAVGTPLKKTVEGGVHIEDLKVGNGAPAKPGKFVQVYYEGRLKSNGKQFDASKSGPGFKFRLGKKEVIQGWDVGVAGMRVGGRRRITCPPNMAYGAKGSPPVIPPNSTLVFEVELKNVH